MIPAPIDASARQELERQKTATEAARSIIDKWIRAGRVHKKSKLINSLRDEEEKCELDLEVLKRRSNHSTDANSGAAWLDRVALVCADTKWKLSRMMARPSEYDGAYLKQVCDGLLNL